MRAKGSYLCRILVWLWLLCATNPAWGQVSLLGISADVIDQPIDQFRISGNKVTVIPNAVDIDDFKFCEEPEGNLANELGFGGMHLEDMIRVTRDGCEPLTSMQTALIVIPE